MTKLRLFVFVLVLVLSPLVASHYALSCMAQSTSATITGQITDSQGRIVPGVEVEAINIDTNIVSRSTTNDSGIYWIPALQPGRYRVLVLKDGFKTINKTNITLNVQDTLEQNFALEIGSINERVTVEAGGMNINTTDGSVSTVVDRQFVDSIPLNGRSLQPLLTLVPGVLLTPVTDTEQGQFSVNGQRADANYFTVDGVSANFGGGASPAFGQAAGGSLPGLNATGGTNNLVSLDAIDQFRVETSSFAPEFGRTPGGQVSIVTKSGTNQFHGDVFDYFRNNALDANDWFYNYLVHTLPPGSIPKPALRQNDFGGVIGGPILKDRTFFFFSYEGLRLVTPTNGVANYPTTAFRQSAPTALQPLLNAFPIPNGQDNGNGTGVFAAGWSNPTNLNAASLRIDHKVNNNITLFGRYNYAPSETTQRVRASSELLKNKLPIQTLTVGSTQSFGHEMTNDIRFNYSKADVTSTTLLDNFGGAVPPPDSLLYPSGLSSSNAGFALYAGRSILNAGRDHGFSQNQVNIVDALALSRGAHQFKFGVDYRRLSSTTGQSTYLQQIGFSNLQSVQNATADFLNVIVQDNLGLEFTNFSLYAQDTWKLTHRLTLTYGLRWELNPPIHATNGPGIFTVENLNDPPNIALAPPGTPLYHTTYDNFAPRVGLAAEVSSKKGFETVVRGGFGIFYDLGSGTLAFGTQFFPYSRSNNFSSVPYPIPSSFLAPPPFSGTAVPPGGIGEINAAASGLELPRSYQWNFAVEQALGSNQSFTVTYVGAAGRDLLRQYDLFEPNQDFFSVYVLQNSATSDYHALQLQYQRRLSHGLQALGFYSWSHSIDDASNDSSRFGNNANLDRGNSDFDIRHSFHGAITWDLPAPADPGFVKSVLHGWAFDAIASVQSAPPIDLTANAFILFGNQAVTARPDVVPGQPMYLFGSECVAVLGPPCAGGKGLNPAAFTSPPLDQNGLATRQGTLGRNVVRGFGVTQVDFALRRSFALTERWNLQFSGELFNAFNHANFGTSSIDGCLCDYPGTFGQASQTLANSLSPGFGQGGFNPLYQVGGPRSIQLALKLRF